uniref:CPG4 domain-containing protein n=1 Tax=Strongyloides papillosus TaxID=174720 RepID=A0A0N5CAF7_STREA
MAILFILSIILYSCKFISSDVFDQLTKEGKSLFDSSIIKGEMTRICTCQEQRECYIIMKKQARECIDECWDGFGKITKRPDDLKKCFSSKDSMLDGLLDCFEHNVKSCSLTFNSTLQPKHNITEIFRLGVLKVEKSKTELSNTVNLMAPIQHIIDTAGEVAICAKNCFIRKNTPKYCFDVKGCQPKIDEHNAKRTLRRCSRAINWKEEAGETCECSVKAGLEDLEQYCPMFRLMASKALKRSKN